jgi:hypothetical protein
VAAHRKERENFAASVKVVDEAFKYIRGPLPIGSFEAK